MQCPNLDLGWFLVIYSVQSSETLSHLLSNGIVYGFLVSTLELEEVSLQRSVHCCALLDACFHYLVISEYNTEVLSSLFKCKTMMYITIKYTF